MSAPAPFYNIILLDDIHNLFPEFLYDSVLFPNNTYGPISWLRYRMTQMFPQTYRRGRLNYEALNQRNTRSDYEEWLFITGRQSQAQQIRMPSYRNEIYTTPTNPIFTNPMIATPPNIRRTWGGDDALGMLSFGTSVTSSQTLRSVSLTVVAFCFTYWIPALIWSSDNPVRGGPPFYPDIFYFNY
jgi:hypothetical protein